MSDMANRGFLAKVHLWLIAAGGLYATFLLLLATPFVQTHAIYLHKLQFPVNARFDFPEKYGFAPFKTRNLNLTTSDGVTIGAWHILPDDYYHVAISQEDPLREDSEHLSDLVYDAAFRSQPTVIYLHGNAANRAAAFRVRTMQAHSSHLNANVLAIDYRGFGDSDSVSPTEEGVLLDARAAWDYAREKGARPDQISIEGQSLGTGVATKLAKQLSDEGTPPKALILTAPFSSVKALLQTYHLFGIIPILSPLRIFPGVSTIVDSILGHRFDSHLLIRDLAPSVNVLLVHAKNDRDIPFTHSEQLFDALLEPQLNMSLSTPPPVDIFSHKANETVLEMWKAYQNERAAKRSSMIKTRRIPRFGEVNRFERRTGGAKPLTSRGVVTLANVNYGGHNMVAYHEGVVDLVGDAIGRKRGGSGSGGAFDVKESVVALRGYSVADGLGGWLRSFASAV